jgi:hypothetical protein
MSFKKLVGEAIAEAWERYHLFMADLPVARMEVGILPKVSIMGCLKKPRNT